MKKYLSLLFLVCLSLGLVACNSQPSKSKIQYNVKYYMQRDIYEKQINLSHAYIQFFDDKSGEMYQNNFGIWSSAIERVHFKTKFNYEYIDSNEILVISFNGDTKYLEGHNSYEDNREISVVKIEVHGDFLSIYDEIFISEQYLLKQGLIHNTKPQTVLLYQLKRYERELFETGAFIINDKFGIEQYLFQRTLTKNEIEYRYSTFLEDGGVYIILHLETVMTEGISVGDYSVKEGILSLELKADKSTPATPYNIVFLGFIALEDITSVEYKIVS